MATDLIAKYSVPGPRYTSYPTVPYWQKEAPGHLEWKARFTQTYLGSNDTQGISLYIHLPYCESLCTYCGCTTRITKNHLVETPYIQGLLSEWSMYLDAFGTTPRISELHLGGGTPTFFSAENLRILLDAILSTAIVTADAAFSFEGHPANTSLEHLQVLNQLGFTRVSFGVQDFDLNVQEAIHRFQTVEQVAEVTELARENGFTSVNYDLVYGLPFQTLHGIKETVSEVIRLKPDRIAFYSYAHVPWMKPGQRKFTELDLPEPSLKRAMYEQGRSMLESAGYVEVGMDHFALQNDELLLAAKAGKLHRNFMGYTPRATAMLVGLGASAISDCQTAYIQNEKHVEDYLHRVRANEFAIIKGHLLTEEDLILRTHITNLMCRFSTSWDDENLQSDALYDGLERLDEAEKDKLIVRSPYRLEVTQKGQAFVRNICMALDARLWRNLPQTSIFSSTV